MPETLTLVVWYNNKYTSSLGKKKVWLTSTIRTFVNGQFEKKKFNITFIKNKKIKKKTVNQLYFSFPVKNF